jgi:uncharacterized membrane protein YgdD (TMEM256/DUF423 family)
MTKRILLTGIILGVLAIILGAFGAHALKEVLDESSLASYKTAVDYQLYHAFFLLIFGILQSKYGKHLSDVIYYLCVLGVVFFSGSIYFLVLNKNFLFGDAPKIIALMTPLGGVFLISAWVMLGVYVIKNLKQAQKI